MAGNFDYFEVSICFSFLGLWQATYGCRQVLPRSNLQVRFLSSHSPLPLVGFSVDITSRISHIQQTCIHFPLATRIVSFISEVKPGVHTHTFITMMMRLVWFGSVFAFRRPYHHIFREFGFDLRFGCGRGGGEWRCTASAGAGVN